MPHQSSKSANESIEKSDSPENFADEFKSFRERAGLKQAEMAALLEAHPNYISQIERGEKVPGKRLIKDFRVLEASPLYRAYQPLMAEESQNMPPPHVELPSKQMQRKENVSLGDPALSHQDYVQCISWLSELFDRHPAIFKSAMIMIKGLYDSVKK